MWEEDVSAVSGDELSCSLLNSVNVCLTKREKAVWNTLVLPSTMLQIEYVAIP